MAFVLRVEEFGSVPDGKTDCTKAFSSALAALQGRGGGVLAVPAGVYAIGPLELPSDTTLRLERGAVIAFSDDPNRYPPVKTRWEGASCFAMHPLLFASGARNITLEGEGALDGNGYRWWARYREKRAQGQRAPVEEYELRLAKLNAAEGDLPSGGGGREMQFLRPPLLQFLSCENVAIRGLALRNSPFWTLHAVFSRKIRIHDVAITNPGDAPNTDGIDIDSCEDVEIVGSAIDVGDDCIALKAGAGAGGVAAGKPTRQVKISHCSFLRGHGGVVIGSETAGGIENIDVSNCRFLGTDRGIRLKSRRGRGGVVQNLAFRNLSMENVMTPIAMNLYYRCGANAADSGRLFSLREEALSELTPRMRNISIENLAARGCRASAAFIVGLPESKIENLSMENCSIEMASDGFAPVEDSEMYEGLDAPASRGMRLRNVECSARNFRVDGVEGKTVLVEDGARFREG